MTQMAQPANRSAKPLWITIGVLLAALVVLANAHLFYTAFSTQPACVAHDKIADASTAALRAAKSGCTWKEAS